MPEGISVNCGLDGGWNNADDEMRMENGNGKMWKSKCGCQNVNDNIGTWGNKLYDVFVHSEL